VHSKKLVLLSLVVVAMIAALLSPAVGASSDPPDTLELPTLGGPLTGGADAASPTSQSSSSGSGSAGSNDDGLELEGRGERFAEGATTDVWALGDYAYTGTFSSPCGGSSPDAGIWVWDVDDEDDPVKVGVIASPTGSRTNDVRVEAMNSGDILVHSNESCAGGPGGFEIYDVDDPENPVALASVRIDEINALSSAVFGGITDVGVHNLFLFTQGSADYVAAVAGTAFDNFQIFDITDPTNPVRVSAWGAEEIFDPGVGDETVDSDRVLNAALDLLSGFGASQNKFLHDATISADGTEAYLANWDAGLVLLDISDPADPQLVSVAIDAANGSLDGEVNSHSVWPSEDGSIVVEGEEDFSAWEATVPPSNLTLDGTATPGDPTIPATAVSTTAGDDFEANQTGSMGSTDGATVTVTSGPLAGTVYPAAELSTAAGSPTFADTGTVTGELVWIGQACTLTGGDVVLNAAAVDPGDIAVVRRGACEFQEKADAAAAAGASAVIIANNNPASTPWSGLRIWDYSDPANPVLASTFNTACSAASTPGGACDPGGTYSVHNVVVEDGKAYVSWYSDGLLVIDISDPYNPVELTRFLDDSTNGGLPNDFWGIYKIAGEDEVFASDRNGGLYIFEDETDDVDDDDDDDDDDDHDDDDHDDDDDDDDDDHDDD